MGRCVQKHKIQKYLNKIANQKHSNRNTKNPNTNPDSPDTHKKTQNAPNASRQNPDCCRAAAANTKYRKPLKRQKTQNTPKLQIRVELLSSGWSADYCSCAAADTVARSQIAPFHQMIEKNTTIPSQHRRHHCHHYRHHHHCHHLHCHHNCHHFLDLMTQNELLN